MDQLQIPHPFLTWQGLPTPFPTPVGKGYLPGGDNTASAFPDQGNCIAFAGKKRFLVPSYEVVQERYAFDPLLVGASWQLIDSTSKTE